jgi:hypothetical protein
MFRSFVAAMRQQQAVASECSPWVHIVCKPAGPIHHSSHRMDSRFERSLALVISIVTANVTWMYGPH